MSYAVHTLKVKTHPCPVSAACDAELRNVDDVDSALICRMAERVSEGKLSVRAAAECAQTFIHDGGSKAHASVPDIKCRCIQTPFDQACACTILLI